MVLAVELNQQFQLTAVKVRDKKRFIALIIEKNWMLTKKLFSKELPIANFIPKKHFLWSLPLSELTS